MLFSLAGAETRAILVINASASGVAQTSSTMLIGWLIHRQPAYKKDTKLNVQCHPFLRNQT